MVQQLEQAQACDWVCDCWRTWSWTRGKGPGSWGCPCVCVSLRTRTKLQEHLSHCWRGGWIWGLTETLECVCVSAGLGSATECLSPAAGGIYSAPVYLQVFSTNSASSPNMK